MALCPEITNRRLLLPWCQAWARLLAHLLLLDLRQRRLLLPWRRLQAIPAVLSGCRCAILAPALLLLLLRLASLKQRAQARPLHKRGLLPARQPASCVLPATARAVHPRVSCPTLQRSCKACNR